MFPRLYLFREESFETLEVHQVAKVCKTMRRNGKELMKETWGTKAKDKVCLSMKGMKNAFLHNKSALNGNM